MSEFTEQSSDTTSKLGAVKSVAKVAIGTAATVAKEVLQSSAPDELQPIFNRGKEEESGIHPLTGESFAVILKDAIPFSDVLKQRRQVIPHTPQPPSGEQDRKLNKVRSELKTATTPA
jgi:hypothetical protein